MEDFSSYRNHTAGNANHRNASFSIEEVARMFNIAPHKIKALQQSTNI
jgi:hypothetical protein